MVRPRIGLSVVLGAVLTLLVAGGDSYLGTWLQRQDFRRDSSLVNAVFVGPVGQTPWPFDLRNPPVARYFAFGAGLLLVVVVAVLIAMIGSRAASAGRGGPAVFLSWWLGVVLGAVAAKVSVLLILQSYLLDSGARGPTLYGYYAGGVQSAAYWGLLVGWFPGLFAALVFLGTNAKTRRQLREEEAALDGDLWPRDAEAVRAETAGAGPAPDPGFTYPTSGDFQEENFDGYGARNAYDAGTPQRTAAFPTREGGEGQPDEVHRGESRDDTRETQVRSAPAPYAGDRS